ncbi:hypothetical protein SPBR_01150 [Sporothrix brasiliensis 5110]|uniref:Uncharacterized protein n=1 Tax=Sporothrix brasiliensis 5110 TaxID=1398154 RepID=A0A0C2J1D3_9PEZI|nr:uncharacterized protein SPBR_01150 [Sporothrix brasiliensis 5110]KIH90927.1 hypothetical protein SPBR_01150 [Sporothrix brasiliensis 5110]
MSTADVVPGLTTLISSLWHRRRDSELMPRDDRLVNVQYFNPSHMRQKGAEGLLGQKLHGASRVMSSSRYGAMECVIVQMLECV